MPLPPRSAVQGFLPAYNALTNPQIEAVSEPSNKNLLVTGAPGTGKTVIALYRSRKLAQKNKVNFLVFSRVLESYLNESFRQIGLDDNSVNTFHSWFKQYCKKTMKIDDPKLSGDIYAYNWDLLLSWFGRHEIKPDFDQLILDEAQDLPVSFIRISPHLTRRLTVFADENQRIRQEKNTTIADIRFAMEMYKHVEMEEYKLEQNFRNTREIAAFAACFRVQGIETGVAELPDRSGSSVNICRIPNGNNDNQNPAIDFIAGVYRNNPSLRIGVILPTKDMIYVYENLFRRHHHDEDRDGEGPVQKYYWQARPPMDPPDFHWSGIYLLTYESCKGLEFDTVFMFVIKDMMNSGNEIDIMRMYVAASRAKNQLFFMHWMEEELPFIKDRLKANSKFLANANLKPEDEDFVEYMSVPAKCDDRVKIVESGKSTAAEDFNLINGAKKSASIFEVKNYTNQRGETFKAVYMKGKYLMRQSEVAAIKDLVAGKSTPIFEVKNYTNQKGETFKAVYRRGRFPSKERFLMRQSEVAAIKDL